MIDYGYFILNLTMVIAAIWIVKKFLDILLEKKPHHYYSGICWLLFGIFQLTAEYRKGSGSVLTTIISIILVFVIAASEYQKTGKIKLFYVIILYVLWILIEMLVFFLMNFVPLEQVNSVMIGSVISKIIMIIAVNIFSVYWEKRKNHSIPNTYFMILMCLPLGSIYIAYNEFFTWVFYKKTISSLLTFSVLLLNNIIIFELYSKLVNNFRLEKENTVYAQQLDIMVRSTEEQKKFMDKFQEEKHNLVNQLIVIKDSIEHSNEKKVIENLNKIIHSYDLSENISNCGNSVIDALINFKYAIAKEEEIDFSLKILIPENLPVNQCDLGIVIGNAIDNAIESTKECKSHLKIINIYMGIKKNALVLVIKNPYEHYLKKDKGGYLISTKKESFCHGYGLNSIKRVVEKYQGDVLVETDNHIFALTIFMNLRDFDSKSPFFDKGLF